MSPEAFLRFRRKFWVLDDDQGGCWQWDAGRSTSGYGTFGLGHRNGTDYAHRVSYQHFVGEISDGKKLHHVCENRLCVNPAHLMQVTEAEHRRLHAPTSCPRGHEYTPENTYLLTTRPNAKACRICTLERQARRRKRLAS